METANAQKPSVFALVKKMSIIFFVLNFVYLLAEYYSGQFEKGEGVAESYLFIITLGIISIVLVKKYRDKELEGYITFGQAFNSTLLSFLISGISGSIVNFIFYRLLHPDAVEKMLKASEVKMIAKGINEATIASSLKLSRFLYTNMAFNIFMVAMMCALFGAVTGLIVGAICRKKPDRRFSLLEQIGTPE